MHTGSEEITVINELCIHKISSHMCENVNIPMTEFNDIMNLQWKISLHQAKAVLGRQDILHLKSGKANNCS